MKIARMLFVFTVSGVLALAAGDAKAGAEVYTKACKSCHGADGAPNAAVAKMMKVEIKHLGDPSVQGQPDSKWQEVITSGVGKMKAVKSIEGKQVTDVIAFGKTLKK